MLYFLLGILAAVAVAFVIMIWKIPLERRDHGEEMGDVAVVVVIGDQGRLLLVDENNQRITRFSLFPGVRAVAVGVGKIMPNGALAVSTREVEDCGVDFDEVDGSCIN